MSNKMLVKRVVDGRFNKVIKLVHIAHPVVSRTSNLAPRL